MKFISLVFVLLLGATNLTAQQQPEWSRVHTFDESTIDMNTVLVTFISKDVTRVRFRWTFDQPQALRGDPQVQYQSRLEVMEFNCSEKRYRPYHFTYFDAAGNVVRVEEMNPPGEWSGASGMMDKLLSSACQLVRRITKPPVETEDEVKLENAGKLGFLFSERLEQVRDFKPLIDSYFASDYLEGYLSDKHINWFLNLDRTVAAKASRAELQRFYVALLNSGYLSAVYLIGQQPYADAGIPEAKLIPTDVITLIDSHPYSVKYQSTPGNHDYLGDKILSVEQLRGYTDLLEDIATLMRRHVSSSGAENSRAYRKVFGDSTTYDRSPRVCSTDCLGLPKGTKLYEVRVPMFQLQFAEIKGKLKVVSVMDDSHAAW